MTRFILHHGPLSPFSEKVRAMLGYTRLHWHSVPALEVPPRPALALLTGGYRRMPVAQIGADIFCDTRIIAAEIARLSETPTLAVENLDDHHHQFVQHADQRVFQAGMTQSFTLTLIRNVLKVRSLWDLCRFIWDRIIMNCRANIPLMQRSQAHAIMNHHIAALESQLHDDFLFGSQPTAADFSAYHTLWYLKRLCQPQWLDTYPRVNTWIERMETFGNGQAHNLSSIEALEHARLAQPRDIAAEDQQDPLIGRQVSIAPSDYAMTPTHGILVGSTSHRWILSRSAPDIGTVHVHFPKHGYQLTMLE